MTAAVPLRHDIARTARSMRTLEHALAGLGYAVLNPDDRSRHMPIPELA